GQGRIVQAEASSGALKLLGIFDFAEIAQRFSFDLSRMLSEGHAFNSVMGSFFLENGLVSIDSPIVVAGAGSQLTLAGEVNLLTESLDNDLIVTLPLNKNLPWYAAYSAVATGPLVGAGVFLAQKVFKKQIDELTSLKYEVSGTFSEPNVQFLSMFDSSLRKSADPAIVIELPDTDTGAVRE
ncbi:MAG: AsmA-like C-terminal region-containing protein, partial [Pseudomonadales bacterium]|nr:AsmA-like C-terminal region-containing protein [Pseudomonadales bacterium]